MNDTFIPGNAEQSVPSTDGSGHGPLIQIVVALIVLAVLFGVGWWLYQSFVPVEDGFGTDTPSVEAPVTRAPEGEVVAGFPEEFLIEDAAIAESYSLDYSDEGFTQPVVRYESAQSLSDNVAQFRAVLVDGGWTITNDADAATSDPVTFFYATRGAEQVNITFVNSATVTVNISYISQ